ncbi:MAG: DNA glycosylase AlkZ-like family protein [Pseudonocardiaceae bacterium]
MDGFVRGLWNIKRDKNTATLIIKLFEPLSKSENSAVTDEGARLLRFAAEQADSHDIQFRPVDESP